MEFISVCDGALPAVAFACACAEPSEKRAGKAVRTPGVWAQGNAENKLQRAVVNFPPFPKTIFDAIIGAICLLGGLCVGLASPLPRARETRLS